MVTYVTPFPCPDPVPPAPPVNHLPILTLGQAGALFIEVINASAQDLFRSGDLFMGDTDSGDPLTVSIVGTPTLSYSSGPLPVGANLSALTSLNALILGTATSNGGTINLGWTYDPTAVNLDFVRPDETITIQYVIAGSDGQAQTAPQTLTFTIFGTNDVPIIQSGDPAFDVSETMVETGAPLSTTGRVVFTDLDRADTPAATVSVLAGAVTTTGIALTPLQAAAFRNGFAITNPDTGDWSYNIAAADVELLGQGDIVRIVYTVTVTDDFGASVTQDVTINIVGTNDAPALILGPAGAPFLEAVDASAQDLATSGALAITDSDSGDPLSATVVGLPTLTYSSGPLPLGVDLSALTAPGVLSFGTGTSNGGTVALGWVYDPTAVNLDFVRPDESITIQYSVAGSDGVTQTAPQTLTFTINGTNDVPIIQSADPAFDVSEILAETGGPLSTTGRVVFTDLDRADTPAATVDVSTGVVTATNIVLTPAQELAFQNGFAITDPDTGAWSYDIAAADTEFMDIGDVVQIVYTVTVTDDFGASVTQDVTITILGTNDAPTLIIGPAAAPFVEDIDASAQDLITSGPLTIEDSDNGDTLTASVIGTPTLTYSSGPLPLGVDLSALTVPGALTFGTGISNGGPVALGWTYDPTAVNLDFVRPDETITIQYDVAGSDGNTQTAPQTLTFTINGTNDAPVIESGDPAFDVVGALTESGAEQTTTGRVTFSDLDRADTPAATVDVSTGVVTATGVTLTPAQETIFRNGFAITNPDTGDWTYTLSALSQFLDTGDEVQIVYTVTVTDDFGASVTQDVTITITGTNDAPLVLASGTATVSEEGLPGAFPVDLGGNPLDTTDSPTASGAISAIDLEGETLTFTLGEPTTPLTSNGQTITWTGAGTGTLTGSAGATPILTVTIDNDGNYAVTLQGPVDHPDPAVEDIITFDVPVNVSDGTATTPTTLTLTIEDDGPQAAPVNESINTVDAQTNLMLILDTSGSMGEDSGLTNLDRMAVMKASVDELLEQYGARGDVRVRIIDFDSDGNPIGTTWMTVAEAKEAVADLDAGDGTNYDAALEAAMDAFDDPGALTGAGVENVSYFISDGDPSSSADGIDAGEQAVWEAFLTANNIVSFALGIPDIDDPGNLDPIAFDPTGTVPDANTPIIVTDLSQLAVILNGTIPPFNGSIPGGGIIDIGAGADGGYGQSVTVAGVTYTFAPDANGGLGDITTSDGSTNFTYDGVSKTLTIDTAPGVDDGDFSIVMTTGVFTFQGAAGFTSGTFDYVIADNDGDTAGSTVTLTATGPGTDRPPIVRDDRVFTNILGDGASIDIPAFAVLYNDEDADGQTITVTAAGPASGGTVSLLGNDTLIFTDDPGSDNGGFFQYTGSTTSPAASDPGLVFVDRDQTGSTLNGTGLGEILIGRDGTNNNINAFEGDDVLIGGDGDDDLDAGDGDDLIVGNAGDDTVDGDAGTDTFRLAGAQTDYTITRTGGTYTIVDNATGDTDTVEEVELFDFNGTVIDVTGDPDAIVTPAPFAPFAALAPGAPPLGVEPTIIAQGVETATQFAMSQEEAAPDLDVATMGPLGVVPLDQLWRYSQIYSQSEPGELV